MDLRQFINRAQELGELKTIEGADWNLEIGGVLSQLPGIKAFAAFRKSGYSFSLAQWHPMRY